MLSESRIEKPSSPVLFTPEVNNSRAGGVYIPPFKLARMQKNQDDKSSPEYQRQTWEALRKSLNGIINKVNVVNIGNIIPELYQENLIRGRGLFCRALMKAQLTSPGFTHVYAALVAIVNTKLPEVGLLLLRRVVFQFRRAFKRNDKVIIACCYNCLVGSRFISSFHCSPGKPASCFRIVGIAVDLPFIGTSYE